MALDDTQPGVLAGCPPDDVGGSLGKGVLSTKAENMAVPVAPSLPLSRPSSITHPEAASATVSCSYIVG
jgi:hypothetical protein